jgi:hypothetical protein
LRRLIKISPPVAILSLLLTRLAKPVRTTTVAQSKDIVLVLDVSASMQTRTPQGTFRGSGASLEIKALPASAHGANRRWSLTVS